MLTRAQKITRTYSVYFLRDPRDLSVRYVGMSYNPRKRFIHHCSTPYDPKSYWVKELKLLGTKPLLQIVASGLCLESAELVERRLAFLHSQVTGKIIGSMFRARRLSGSKNMFLMAQLNGRPSGVTGNAISV